MHVTLTSYSLVFSLPLVCYMVADPGYDDKKLYVYSKSIENRSGLSSVERYKNTPRERIELVYFYESALGQFIYNRRGISVEPLIEHIKSVFRIDSLSIRGFQVVSGIVLFIYFALSDNGTIPVKQTNPIQNQ
jgi:hypothetical protein